MSVQCQGCRCVPFQQVIVVITCNVHKHCRACGGEAIALVVQIKIRGSTVEASIAHNKCCLVATVNARSPSEEILAVSRPVRELTDAPIVFGFLKNGAGKFIVTFADTALEGAFKYAYVVLEEQAYIRYVVPSEGGRTAVTYFAEKYVHTTAGEVMTRAAIQLGPRFQTEHMSKVPPGYRGLIGGSRPAGRNSREMPAIHCEKKTELVEHDTVPVAFAAPNAAPKNTANMSDRLDFGNFTGSSAFGRQLKENHARPPLLALHHS